MKKDWNHEIRLKSWNPENLHGNPYPNHEIRLKSWNKIEILKQDQFRKNKNSYICVVLSHFFAPRPAPLFFALKIVITTDLATCLRVRLCLLCKYFPRSCSTRIYLGSSYRQNWNIPWDTKTYLQNVFLHLSSSVYEKGFLDHCCLCDIWIQREWIWIGWEQIWERKRKNYLLTMTRIIKQPRNISESFIFVRENILKLDLIYLLRRDQRCYVYVFMFFSPGQVIWNSWAVPDDRQMNT